MARIANLVLKVAAALALASCQTQPAQDSPPKSPAVQSPAVTPIESPPVAIKPVPQDAQPAQTAPTAQTAPPPQTAPPQAKPSPAAPEPPKPTSSAAKAPPKNSTAPSAPETKPATSAAASAAPKPAPLDLNSLEQRLKDTRAIGVFTKLSLKNQVDDLLSELREFHQGSAKMPQSVLRQKYDLLIIKVLSLLQDGDPMLATAIASSREAIWGILMDPNKFANI